MTRQEHDQNGTEETKQWFGIGGVVADGLDIHQLKQIRELGKLHWGYGLSAQLKRRNTVLRLEAEGRGVGEIAEAVGMSKKRVQEVIREYKYFNPDPTQLALWDDAKRSRRETVLRLNAEGKPTIEIARAVGLSVGRVKEIIRDEARRQAESHERREFTHRGHVNGNHLGKMDTIQEDPEEAIQRRQRMTALAKLFPCLEGAEGVSPWDPKVLSSWATYRQIYKFDNWQMINSTVRFLLAVWDPRGEAGRFDSMIAFVRWDAAHREQFLAWARAPWWPYPTDLDPHQDSPWLPLSMYVTDEKQGGA